LLLFDFVRERVEADFDLVRRADFLVRRADFVIFSSGVNRLSCTVFARRPCLK
jgi:hypothetical protein